MIRCIRRTLIVGVAVVCALLTAHTAVADQVRDPDDVAGKFDYKKLSADKPSRRASAAITMVFYDGFRAQALKRPNALTLRIDVNVNGTEDFRGTIRYSRGGILMKIDDLGGSDPFNPLPVFRLSKDTYRVVLPSGQPYNTRGKKAFYATSKFCPSACVVDRAPDADWVTT